MEQLHQEPSNDTWQHVDSIHPTDIMRKLHEYISNILPTLSRHRFFSAYTMSNWIYQWAICLGVTNIMIDTPEGPYSSSDSNGNSDARSRSYWPISCLLVQCNNKGRSELARHIADNVKEPIQLG